MRKLWVCLLSGVALGALSCGRGGGPKRQKGAPTTTAPSRTERPAVRPWRPQPPLAAGQTYRYRGHDPEPTSVDGARADGLLDVDLSDQWAPFIFQDSSGPDDPAKPNDYRGTFVALANERVNVDGMAPRRGEHHYLEVFGIPPTLSVLRARIEEDGQPQRQSCYAKVDLDALRTFTGNIVYADRERAKREYLEAVQDAAWLDKEVAQHLPFAREAAIQILREDPKARGRVDRFLRGQERLRAVRAAQARLVCEGLLADTGRNRFVDGMYDLLTHEALASWEKKNDIFGWGFLGGETVASLLRAPLDLHFDTFKRILAERVADAAGIVEDGSTMKWRNAPTYRDEAGIERPVPNLIGDFVDALLASMSVSSPEAMVSFLRAHGAAGLGVLHVAYAPPPLPPYYSPDMDLSVEIDRGDVWYDFPFDGQGKPILQHRDRFPHLKVYVAWRGQRIPLCWWRTTIGSWRSELHADGRVYMKYKNSDVGRRIWKNVVAGPVWVPPDVTPAKDLLTRKVLDRNVGPVTVVNRDVMGPGFQSAYGLVMAVHLDPKRGGFDNQIRTHGSVDYTSIARRFSHGCHRLVNNRAVRLFDFVLRHRPFQRLGNMPLGLRKRFVVDEHAYSYELKTRGYSYELARPIPVNVTEGRIVGQVKQPITAYVRKSGVDYSAPSSGDGATSIASPTSPADSEGEAAPPPETVPEPEP